MARVPIYSEIYTPPSPTRLATQEIDKSACTRHHWIDQHPQVLHPCDEVVGLVCFDPDSGAPELIDPDSKLMDELFPVAAALFEEDDVELMRTASVLTMQGEASCESKAGGSSVLDNALCESPRVLLIFTYQAGTRTRTRKAASMTTTQTSMTTTTTRTAK